MPGLRLTRSVAVLNKKVLINILPLPPSPAKSVVKVRDLIGFPILLDLFFLLEGVVALWCNPLTLQPEQSGGVGSNPGPST